MSIEWNLPLIGSVIVFVLGVGVFGWDAMLPLIRSWIGKLTGNDTAHDGGAPPGMAEYVACVRKCAPSATGAVLLDYLSAGLSEIDILRAEVARLTPKE